MPNPSSSTAKTRRSWKPSLRNTTSTSGGFFILPVRSRALARRPDAYRPLPATQKPCPNLSESRIVLKGNYLHEGNRTIELHRHPGDASCGKDPQDASPDFLPKSQTTEKEELKMR